MRISFRHTDNSDTLNDENHRPVLLYGCSFVWGAGLNDDETFSYHIKNITKRPVYNRGLLGFGIQHMLYMLRNNVDLMKQNEDFKNPEYIIYTFMEDHLYRLYKFNDYFDICLMFYKYNNDKTGLVEFTEKDILYWHSYILRNMKMFRDDGLFGSNYIKDEAKNFLKMHFIASHNAIKEKFPGSSFIIFVYDGDIYIKSIEQELKSDGINIVYLSDLSNTNFKDPQYLIEDGLHPSGKAWKEITPLLTDKLKL